MPIGMSLQPKAQDLHFFQLLGVRLILQGSLAVRAETKGTALSLETGKTKSTEAQPLQKKHGIDFKLKHL